MAPSTTVPVDLYAWVKAIRSTSGPASSTARHVLLTLATYMTRRKLNAYPTIHTLAKATALNERSVRRVLKQADADGWVTRRIHENGGKQWGNYEYTAGIPAASPPERAGIESAPSPGSRPLPSLAAGIQSLVAGLTSPTCGHSVPDGRAQSPTKYPLSIHSSIQEDSAIEKVCKNESPFKRINSEPLTNEQREKSRQDQLRRLAEKQEKRESVPAKPDF